MKRDIDLARKILLAVELFPDEVEPCRLLREEIGEPVFAHHGRLLIEAGLIRGHVFEGDFEVVPTVILQDLTWAGHEFLDAARDPGRWSKARSIAKDKAGSLSFEVLKGLLNSLMRAAVGL